MQNLNKKGISDLVSNVLIILLVVTLIGTVSTQIFQLVKSPALSPEKNCPLLISKNILQVQNICFNELSQETEITLFLWKLMWKLSNSSRKRIKNILLQ